MNLIINFLVGVVALLHIYFMILEMFFWTKPKGLKIFNQSLEKANASKILAANQGLYNGFLATGLFWGLLATPDKDISIKIFFLSCVTIAGFYGGYTVSKKIMIVQALPAVLGLLAIAIKVFS